MYYTIPEAMKIVKAAQQTLHKWIESGQLPIIKIDKVARIDANDLEGFMQSHKIRRGQAVKDQSILRKTHAIRRERRKARCSGIKIRVALMGRIVLIKKMGKT